MRMVSYAQNFEDVILSRVLTEVKAGFYIDIGAQDPLIHSVTNFFYMSGWSGINIEPVEEWFIKLQEARPRDVNIKCLVGSLEGNQTFYEIPNSGLSTGLVKNRILHESSGHKVHESVERVRTLKGICEDLKVGEIHFLKIDVEGAEKDVLLGANFVDYRPWIIVIESTEPNSQVQNFENWEQILVTSDYQFAYADGLNRFYLSKEKINLLERFQFPPNIFDNFLHFQSVEMIESLSALRQDIKVKEDQLAQSSATIKSTSKKLELAQMQLVQAESRAAAAQMQLVQAESRAAAAQMQLVQAESRAAAAQELETSLSQMLSEIQNSRSWRITKILRLTSNFFKSTSEWRALKMVLRFKLLRLAEKFPKIRKSFKSILKYLGLEQKVRELFGMTNVRSMFSKNDPEWENTFQVLSEFVMPPEIWKKKFLDLYGDTNEQSARNLGFSEVLKDMDQIPSGKLSISVISSLYKSDLYLPNFLLNLQDQTIFHEVEFSIVSVLPSDYERRLLEEFATKSAKIRIEFVSNKIGIYRAWNIAIANSTGDLITNANADDLRRKDCLAMQRQVLEESPWCDVVYQDVYYSHVANASWDQIAAINSRSNLPHVTHSSLLAGVNCPHNAPMWRRTLHEELGAFDELFETAGDYEYWLRCSAEGKRFLKIQEPIVAYYFSPTGLSTIPGGKGLTEAETAKSRYRNTFMATLPKVTSEKTISRIDESSHIAEVYTRQQLDVLKASLSHE